MTRSAGTGPDAALRRIAECRLVVVIRLPTTADALQVGRILLAAGVEVLEVTGTTPEACDVLAALRLEAESRVLLGVGSIRTVKDARRADDADADFLVSPGSPASLIESMLATGRLVLPGVFTATEVMQAMAIGARAVKLFPALTARVRDVLAELARRKAS
jgi:2-dehydro-3-deoxyphosphogluconate aldolase/(4S)-4-hydroxy-2-oxoglutarate aldolase